MKKIIYLLTILIVVMFSICACNNNKEQLNNNFENQNSQVTNQEENQNNTDNLNSEITLNNGDSVVETVKEEKKESGNQVMEVVEKVDSKTENIEKEERLIIKDYCKDNLKLEDVYTKLTELSRDEVVEARTIAKLLGYDSDVALEDTEVSSKGYRLLNKIPKMPTNIIENMVNAFGSFKDIIRASIEELDDVEGIGEIRAKNIKQGLTRMQEQFLYDSRFYR